MIFGSGSIRGVLPGFLVDGIFDSSHVIGKIVYNVYVYLI